MFVAIGMTTMDLEPVKRSARNEEKRREEKTFSLVADQEIYYFKKGINFFLSPTLVCVFVLFAVMQKAVTTLQGMGNNSL